MDLSKNKHYTRILKFLSIFLAVTLSYGIGWAVGQERLKIDQGFVPRIINKSADAKTDFSLFWRIWDDIESKYDGQIDRKKMLYGAISGMVNAIGDPYTYYMDPDQAKQFDEEISGTIYGIGAEIGNKDNQITVISPIPGSPAEKAGLKAGDAITSIDGVPTTGMTVDQAVLKIRGQAGTQVKLNVSRGAENKELNITRDKIEIKSVNWNVKDQIGYLQIKRFSDDTEKLTDEGLQEFKNAGVKGIIIDLRNNPGGYLDSSIKVASQFVKDGNIVIEKQDGKVTQEHKAVGFGKYTDPGIPVVVLVNKGSASASEIVAGALQDHKRAVLIGEQTFGKGSVQEVKPYPDNSNLRVTVAHWFTPNGNTINEKGLTPDIKVEVDESKVTPDNDPVLQKGLENLKSKL